MTTRYFAAALLATLFAGGVLSGAAHAQSSPADLLQKGIYDQETLGDLDGAMQIYRQVTGSTTAPKQLAARAQYQLVLCMLQKGDRAAASHELDLLTRNFPDQQDFINKARKLIPGASTLLAPPWDEGEASQLNIKRDGAFTGEYLFYAATPGLSTLQEDQRDPVRNHEAAVRSQIIFLGWKLVTKMSTRSALVSVDRDTMRHMDLYNNPNPSLDSNDDLGDATAAPFAGPAIDAEPLVFRMRVLPLAVGYKTTLTTQPFLLRYGAPRPVELAVTAVEPVQTVAGKFNCYRVSFAALGQKFWIGVDGSRPLVKFQSGSVEAELVKMWGPSVFDDGVAFFTAADGEAGLQLALSAQPDLMLLDIMLPKVNGYEICRAVRAHSLDYPILMLTARGQEEDVVLGLNLGADDYVTKPFKIRELVARVNAFLRRRQAGQQPFCRFGDFELDLASHKLFRGGREVELTAKEFRLLAHFAARAGRALARNDILDAVWGNSVMVTQRSIDRCVTTLRAKIEPDPRNPTYIQTIRDVGYRFETGE
jgi:DNA-binding response OmpR family regulator